MNSKKLGERRSLTRNTLLNGVTQVGLALVSFLCYPFIAGSVSAAGFGLLAIIWMLIGYLGIFDLGLGWAATRTVAQAVSDKDHNRAGTVARNAALLGLILGLCVGIALFVLREWIVGWFAHDDSGVAAVAMTAITLVAVAVPFCVVHGIVRGVLQGLQRFDIMNGLQIGTGVVQWVGSVVLVTMGYGVVEIVILTVAARVVFSIAGIAVIGSLLPGVFGADSLMELEMIREVIRFGRWVTVSRIISPLFLYIDRLLIGALVSLPAVGFYTVPQEAVTRLLIIPASLTMALFPVFSSFKDLDRHSVELRAMYNRSVKYLLLVVVPLATGLILFSSEILGIWMGPEFSDGGSRSFEILSVGFAFNALAQVPMILLISAGRPEIPAKFHLIEFPCAILLTWIMLKQFGIVGAAVTWSLRVMIDSLLLFRSSRRILGGSPTIRFAGIQKGRILPYALLLGASLIMLIQAEALGVKTGLAIAACVLYSIAVWRHVLTESDKNTVRSLAANVRSWNGAPR